MSLNERTYASPTGLVDIVFGPIWLIPRKQIKNANMIVIDSETSTYGL
jgi:hypothetical protein